MGVFDMVGVRRHSTTIVHVAADRRGRNDHNTLFGCARSVQGVVYSELDMEVFRDPELLRPYRGCGRHRPDNTILGLLLGLLYQVSRDSVCNKKIC